MYRNISAAERHKLCSHEGLIEKNNHLKQKSMATKRQVSNSEDENDLHSLTTQNEDICLFKLNQNDQTPGGTKRRKKKR
ncbi:unnamed protein product [Rotaria sp. Silwood2]|nr:unnamed protein product [Rotaria sp. Silwood2]